MKNLLQKIIVFSLCCVIVAPSISGSLQNMQTSQNQSQSTNSQFIVDLSFSLNDFSFDQKQGYDFVSLSNGGLIDSPSEPALPYRFVRVALPYNVSFESVSVVSSSQQDLSGQFMIYPAQNPSRFSDQQSSSFVAPDQQIYSSDVAYPNQIVKYSGQSDLAGQSFAEFIIYPLQFVPSQQKLILIDSLSVELNLEQGYTYGDYLPSLLSGYRKADVQTSVEDLVLNPQDVVLNSNDEDNTPLGVGPGFYDYVIITKNSWVSHFQALADWRTESGLRAKIVTTQWIYLSGGYTGSDGQKIRQFVEDAYQTWGARFFLIGGDETVIPTGYVQYPSVDSGLIASDTWYADFDDDFICEVNIGRAPVTRVDYEPGGIANFVVKVMNYELSPPLSSFVKDVGLFGFDLDANTHGEECMEDINATYIPSEWSVSKVYDSDASNHKIDVDDAVHDGLHLINHIDHANEYYFGVGSFNHEWWLTSSEVRDFSNGDHQSIWYSLGCYANSFDSNEAIGEYIVRDDDGGGVAFVGNSRYGYYYENDTDSLSFRFDKYFFRSLFLNEEYLLGDCFSDHKNEGYLPSDTYKYLFSELTLTGDPALEIWTDDPDTLSTSHPSEAMKGEMMSFPVHVSSENGSAVEGALVCLYTEDNLIFETELTDANGNVTFSLNPITNVDVRVTAKKHNFIPYRGTASVFIRPVANSGGPYEQYVNESFSVDASLSVDGDGTIVDYAWDLDDDGIYEINSSEPTYLLNYSAPINQTIDLQVTDNEGFIDNESTWINVSYPPPNVPPTADAGGPYQQYVNISLLLDASSSTDSDGSIVEYEWDWDNDSVFDTNTSSATIEHIFTSVGNHTVNLRVWDDEGANGSDSVVVSIIPTPPNDPPVADAGGPYNITVNETYVFDASASYDPDGGIVLYQWDWTGDGSFDANNTAPTIPYSYDAIGNYTLVLRVSDVFGFSDTQTTYVLVNPPPPNQAPEVPYDPYPEDGATNITYESPNLSWTCEDPEGDDVTFCVYVGLAADSLSRVSNNQSSSSYSLDSLTHLTTYYWKIVAFDDGGRRRDGLIWSFTTMQLDNDPPVRPTVSGPAEGRINTPLQYSIFSSDIDGDPIYYYVEWGDGSIESWVGPYASGDDVVVSHIYSAQGTYAIRVRARDIHGAVSEWKTLSVVTAYVPDNPWLDMLVGWIHELALRFPIFERLLDLPFFSTL